MLWRAVGLLVLLDVALSASIIKELPGFPGHLPFKLETGYIGVGELDDAQLFYYFIESERSPKQDPLFLWLTGGPGCSSFSGLVYEIGPLSFNYANSSRTKPQFSLNPYSWTKVANIIFLDQPIGTGFSYAKNWTGYNTLNDTLAATDSYNFLRKWLIGHPEFLANSLYITGDSYGGKIVPIIAKKISEGNEAGIEPMMNLKGYVSGNPVTDENIDSNARVPFAHLNALISDELFESTERNCKGKYVDPDPNNTLCIKDLLRVEECLEKVNMEHILEPACAFLSPKPKTLKWDSSILIEDTKYFLSLRRASPEPWCRYYSHIYSYIWANDKIVQKALHVREGTIEKWVRCNKSLIYSEDVISTIEYHRYLITKGYRALIYSGDQDMIIPYVGTQTWIKSLNLTIQYDWQPWFVDGQVAGYTRQDYEIPSSFTYTTVKGGGHTAPAYKPKECLAMISRWLAYFPI
ncbi:serine carboxypeptidase-like 17 isoform X1 [Mangifera indica]|uniref:serine carboxypeptidase-like 17 isoform X1 n=1 Tax=Mangifera indica TaxID=29780 RepID=UPI001CFC2060|nr:serine carboxypeptidase-like 17 isoform X1 [Mangifera indica]